MIRLLCLIISKLTVDEPGTPLLTVATTNPFIILPSQGTTVMFYSVPLPKAHSYLFWLIAPFSSASILIIDFLALLSTSCLLFDSGLT